MKNVIGILAVAFATLVSPANLQAQERFASIGVELGLPLGDLSNVFGLGGGLSAAYEFGLTDRIAIGANVGYTLFTGESVDSGGTSVDGESQGFTIAQPYGRFYFNEGRSGAFIGALFGWHIATYEDFEGRSVNEADFGVAPEVGYFLTNNISVAVRYQMLFPEESDVTDSYLGLRAAYNF